MENWGAKATQKGKGITSSVPEDYVVSSAYNTMKITNEVYGEFVVDNELFIEDVVNHNLGYIPQCRAYFYNSLSKKWFAPPVVVNEPGGIQILCGFHCDDMVFALGIYTPFGLPPYPPAGTVIKWKIYIFANPEGETWT
jgi:hypothetical protein